MAHYHALAFTVLRLTRAEECFLCLQLVPRQDTLDCEALTSETSPNPDVMVQLTMEPSEGLDAILLRREVAFFSALWAGMVVEDDPLLI